MAKKSAAKLVGMPWNFADLMNMAISCLPEYPMQKRNRIWASELGGDYVTRYLKMHAHPYSNPFNDKMKRKMISSQIFEWVVYFILTMCGVLKGQQMRGEVELPGMLMVSGKNDFYAGGYVDYEKAKAEVQRIKELFSLSISSMPPIIFHSIDKVLARMEMMFSRVPLMEVILECKAVSGFVYPLIEKSKKPRQGHPLQTLHYLTANKIPQGALLYINKDCFMCEQFDITPTKELVTTYKNDVAAMTDIYNNSGKNYLKNIPPKSPEIHFEEASYRFVKNNMVEYSPYLEFIWNIKSIDDFKLKWDKTLSSWNRTFKRCVNGDKMTILNLETIHAAQKAFPDWDKYVAKAKASGVFDKPGEDEDGE